MYPVYVSNDNSKREKKIFVLMISNREWWNDHAVFKSSLLLRGITWKHDGGFYYLNFLQLFNTKHRFESHKKVCENKDFF